MRQALEISELIEVAQQKTRRMPELAVSHALELDRQLRKKGFQEPVTYSATDWFNGRTSANGIADHKDPQTPLTTLWRADQLRRTGQHQSASALAFQSAQRLELPALNLIYANLSLDNEAIWLTFLNKYLSHRAALDGRPSHDYALALTSDGGSRFSRLTLDTTPNLSNQEAPMISVLMPVYNAARTLEMAANSILEQTWRALELILIDDASADESLTIANKLKQKDPRVRVVELGQNGGPYVARNTGVQHAKGEYITIHDADDWALPTRLESQIQDLKRSPTKTVSVGHMLRIHLNGLIGRMQPRGWITPDGALRLCFPSMLFDRTYFKQKLIAWDNVRAGADFEMFQRIQRFDPKAMAIGTNLTMLQLDSANSLTNSKEFFSNEQGLSQWRQDYQRQWMARHQEQRALPFQPLPR
jgi:hypothetical protein